MKLLRVANLNGIEWSVFEVEPGDTLPEGMDADTMGVALTDSARIYFRRSANPRVTRVTAAHEWMHALLDASGGASLLAALAKASNLDPEAVEEALVSVLAPVLASLLETY